MRVQTIGRVLPSWLLLALVFDLWVLGGLLASLLYHGAYPTAPALMAASIVWAIPFLLAWPISRVLPVTRPLIRIALVWIFMAAVLSPVVGQIVTVTPRSEKFLALAAALPFAFAMLLVRSPTIWAETKIFILVCTLIAASYGLTIRLVEPTKSNHAFGLEALNGVGRPDAATLLIVLDETSPRLVDRYENALRKGRTADIKSTIVTAAGGDTITAIPAMLLGRRLDDVKVCGTTSLCSKAEVIDFEKLEVNRPDVDIVGFWHPYCSMRGLRSCFRTSVLLLTSPFMELSCRIRRGLWIGCYPPAGDRDRALVRIKEAIDRAPFWQKGGVLFLHLPVPHPSFERTPLDLATEYEQNAESAAAILSNLKEHLDQAFPDGYRMIVTSDHALRVEYWCNTALYSSPHCAQNLPPNEGKVPVITVTPAGHPNVLNRTDNVGIFH